MISSTAFDGAAELARRATAGVVKEAEMGNAFVVEVRGRHAGLLIRLDDGFRFLASLPEVYDLDEQVFPDKAAACAAVEARFDALQAGHLPAYAAFSLGRVDDGLRLAS